MTYRFIATILSCSAMLAIIFSSAPKEQENSKAEERTDYELCQDVEEELNRAAQEGTITEEEARRTADRCFDLFTGGR